MPASPSRPQWAMGSSHDISHSGTLNGALGHVSARSLVIARGCAATFPRSVLSPSRRVASAQTGATGSNQDSGHWTSSSGTLSSSVQQECIARSPPGFPRPGAPRPKVGSHCAAPAGEPVRVRQAIVTELASVITLANQPRAALVDGWIKGGACTKPSHRPTECSSTGNLDVVRKARRTARVVADAVDESQGLVARGVAVPKTPTRCQS